ncbi:Magnesium transport protein CorA [Labeo rohita]|uniref:Magnesium transport protein CorA n=1 Tax=Labeo rohita TaxID=84645 RepID=A0ABQ8L700_LABRO|nr:Magnesium transport protein CorA [Labeo rohita]
MSACRLLLSCLIVWLLAWYSNCGALVVYDRQLDIRSTLFNFHKSDVECVFNKQHESLITDIPDCIRRWPLNNLRRKRRRKRGCQGGLAIKLKARLPVSRAATWRLCVSWIRCTDGFDLFSQCFTKSCSHLLLDSPLSDLDADEHLSLLNSAWLDVMNETAPLKPLKHKPKSELWHTAETRLLRQTCRKAERKWKKDSLHISLQLFKDSLLAYQRAAKLAKATYFSNLILDNHSRPKVLFSVINSVVNPRFSRFFKGKVSKPGLVAYNPSTELPVSPPLSASWNDFESVSLQSLKDTIAKLKPSSSSYDVRNLGVLLDDTLKFDKQISTVIGSSFYQLRTLAKIKHFLTDKTLEMAVHAFITSRLDYCNSLYCGISKSQIARLQLVQNAAAKFLLKKKKGIMSLRS